MSLLANSNAISAGGYDIKNSLRFRASASASLSRTPASAGNRQIMTYSFWVKRGALTADYNLTNATTDASNSATLYFNSSNSQTFDVFLRVAGTNYSVTTSQVFRDPSSWYHIVVAIDTTQATASNRTKVYVNGTQVTAFLTANYVPQNSNLALNNNVAQSIGGTSFFDGYMAEVNFIDGQALTASSFGATDAVTGVWAPKPYTGTYGTNGFYLPFRLNSSSGFSSYYGSFNGTTQSLSATLPSTLSGQFTIEGFIRPNVVAFNPLFTLGDSSTSTGLEFYFGGGSTPSIYSNNGFQIQGSYNIPATVWAHIAVTRDASNVIRLFINGTQVGETWTSTAAFSNTVRIGAEFYSGSITGRMNGFISNFRIVTGSALYTSTFTPPSSALTAVSGTQLLTLQNSTIIDNSTNALTVTNTGSVATTSATVANTISDVGYEYSGNRNTWTTNNINYTSSGTTYDAMTDSPTLTSATVANYAVMNSAGAVLPGGGTNMPNFAEATLRLNGGSAVWRDSGVSTINMKSGKWYIETTVNTLTGGIIIGLIDAFNAATVRSYRSNATKYINATQSAYGSSYGAGSVVGLAIDCDGGTLTCYVNNVSQGALCTDLVSAMPTNGWFYNPQIYSSSSVSVNFGQRPFAYTPPTGFVALNAYNLPDSTIKKGNSYMDATTYTGTGSALTVTNAGNFRPDFVWAKNRSAGDSSGLYDSVRGVNQRLISNLTNAEDTSSGVSAFNSNGFSLGTAANYNTNGNSFVGWQWQAGSSTVTNTSGSISSQVRANTTAGFSIVTWTGTGSAATVGHGLGVAPKMVISKKRNGLSDWAFWITGFAGTELMELNGTSGKFTGTTVWNSTTPTSTVFSVGSATQTNNSGGTYVAYLWSEIAGFSKFGSYTGNGSTDGPFVYLGFRPKFILIKVTSAANDWGMYDSTRNPTNLAGLRLQPNSAGAEVSASNIDFLSNGFKLRNNAATTEYNGNGSTYIYAAFAENPFKNSLAR